VIQQKNKCIFLDRDGVLNLDRNTYTYRIEDFVILPGVAKALTQLKETGFLLIVITNQAGIAKGLYTPKDMQKCHDYLQANIDHRIDAFYYSPYHPTVTESLSRKPDSLMFEKAITRFHISAADSWMIGDQERDIIPAKKLGIRTLRIIEKEEPTAADLTAKNLTEAAHKILTSSSNHG
jgi:D-glycero-D-manno-heptose 1,7-bisphosphate phosphatase